MAGSAPEEIIDDEQLVALWIELNHVFDEHTGTEPELFDQREREFVRVINLVLERLFENRPELRD